MISHFAARRLIDSLTGDPETLASLTEYVRQQERGPIDFEGLSERQHATMAANRAVEAISRAGTLTTELREAEARIAAVEAQGRDLAEVLEAVLAMIEAR